MSAPSSTMHLIEQIPEEELRHIVKAIESGLRAILKPDINQRVTQYEASFHNHALLELRAHRLVGMEYRRCVQSMAQLKNEVDRLHAQLDEGELKKITAYANYTSMDLSHG